MDIALKCAQAASTGPDVWTIGSTIGAALLGALIAGVASYYAATLTAKEARGIAAAQLRESERISTIRVLVKLFSIASALAGYNRQLTDMLKAGEEELGPEHPWRYVLGIAGGNVDHIHFEADDLIAFVKAGETGYVSEVIMLAGRFAPLEAAYETYRQRRDAFLERLKADRIEGNRGSGELTREEMAWAGPMMADLNYIIDGLKSNTAELFNDAQQLCERFGPIAQKYFNDPGFPRMALVSAAAGADEAPADAKAA